MEQDDTTLCEITVGIFHTAYDDFWQKIERMQFQLVSMKN